MEIIDVEKIYRFLDEVMPFSTQEDWDNSGLLIESSNQRIAKILVCLDVTDGAIEKAVAEKCQMILSHHPVIFSPILKITKDSVEAKIIKNDIAVISAHTNFDKYRYGTCFHLLEATGLKGEVLWENIGLTVELSSSKAIVEILKDFKQKVKHTIKYTISNMGTKKLFIIAGSGKGMIDEISKSGATCVITGELGYHDMLDLKARGISAICIGHDLSEQISIQPLCGMIKKQFKDIEVIPFTEKPIEEFY